MSVRSLSMPVDPSVTTVSAVTRPWPPSLVWGGSVFVSALLSLLMCLCSGQFGVGQPLPDNMLNQLNEPLAVGGLTGVEPERLFVEVEWNPRRAAAGDRG